MGLLESVTVPDDICIALESVTVPDENVKYGALESVTVLVTPVDRATVKLDEGVTVSADEITVDAAKETVYETSRTAVRYTIARTATETCGSSRVAAPLATATAASEIAKWDNEVERGAMVTSDVAVTGHQV